MFKRIAVHIDKDPACAGRLATALALAKTHEAQIVGIYVQDPPFNYGYDEVVVSAAVLEVQRTQMAEERQKCTEYFCQRVALTGQSKSWVAVQGALEDELALHSRCSDILIMSQADPQTHRSSVQGYQLESVILTAGRPVLTIPFATELTQPVDKVLLCWDQGRESARAIADAAPFLELAKEIVVLTVDKRVVPEGEARKTMSGLDDYLRAHGYAPAKAVSASSKESGIGNAILNTAADFGSNLIVMGLYGHSRAREWVLGGASREMMSDMTIPVLFSH
ncbi:MULTISPECIES: universal stress protein [unclassified Achromobacter]|uniref:universal stress protein n=1 Tax=unclassified Achromobacter TaxID=2626865 RepID=UPI00130308BB|nr:MULTISPECIES: universal stress protein [unclassified Achromobacter]